MTYFRYMHRYYLKNTKTLLFTYIPTKTYILPVAIDNINNMMMHISIKENS